MNEKSKEYFNIRTSGVGYVDPDSIKRLQNADGDFGVAKVRLANGHKDAVKYVHFDCIVATDDATSVLHEIKTKYAGITTVFCKLDFSGLETGTFAYPDTSERAGETGVNLKSRIMGVRLLSVDGEKVQQPEEKAPAADADTSKAEEIDF